MFAASAILGGVAAAAIAAAWADWRRRRIQHAIVTALAGGWALVSAVMPSALGGSPVASLACAAGALGFGSAMWVVGWLGAGDVRFAAAIALWLGPADLGIALVGAGLLLTVLAGTTTALGGSLPQRDLPVAVALAPPSVALLAFRAVDVASLATAT